MYSPTTLYSLKVAAAVDALDLEFMTLQEVGPVDAELQQLRERVARLEREAAEQGRRESEERFQQVADTAPVMLWMSVSVHLRTMSTCACKGSVRVTAGRPPLRSHERICCAAGS